VTPAERSGDARLAAVLSGHAGTVTDLLEQRAGEPVEADVRAQWRSPARPGNPLELDTGEELVQRAVVLRGRRSGRAYVYAESSIATARLPASVGRRLEETSDPIGRVLDDHHLAVRREPLAGPARAAHADDVAAELLAGAPWSRRYRILLGTAPAFAVDEWFLQPAADVLVGAGRG
jgi:chorismate--pyruvate lyase